MARAWHLEFEPAPMTREEQALADRAVRWIERLRHTKDRWFGQPFKLLPWQEMLVREVFGRLREDGTRRYKRVFIAIPRKNGKSTLAAALALKLLAGDGIYGARVYSAAADRDQASIVWDEARRMAEMSWLRKYVRPYTHRLVVEKLGATYTVLSKIPKTKHGLDISGVLVDELHALQSSELWDVLTTGVGARANRLVISLTTAGYDRAHFAYDEWEYARQVRDGIIQDETLLPVIYESEEGDDWEDRRVWEQVNPSLGATLLEDYLEEEARRARHLVSRQNLFRRLHLNQWTSQATRWIDLKLWDAQGGEPIDESDESLREMDCYGGLDVSSVSDMTAWVLVFAPRDRRDVIYVLPRLWVPEARLYDQSNRYAQQYQAWAKEGYLRVIPGNVIDHAVVEEQVVADAQRFRLRSANIDRLFQGHQLTVNLQKRGIDIYPMGQGFMSYAAPMKEFERLLRGGGIRHGGHPVLRWMADNVSVRQDSAGNLKPDKANSQGKIDGITALVMAIDRWMRSSDEGTSVYEERGIIVL